MHRQTGQAQRRSQRGRHERDARSGVDEKPGRARAVEDHVHDPDAASFLERHHRFERSRTRRHGLEPPEPITDHTRDGVRRLQPQRQAIGFGGRLPVTEGRQRLGPPVVKHGVVGMERHGAAPDPQRFGLVVAFGRGHPEVVEVGRRGHGAEGEPLADQDADGGRDQVSHTDQRGNPRTVGGATIRSATSPPPDVTAHGRGQDAQIPAESRGRIAAAVARVVPSLEGAAVEERPGFARARRALGGLGAMSGPPSKEMSMIDVKTADRELHFYIRPQTFPVAIRMLGPGEAIPERARRPARDFKKLSMNCQVIDMARRNGGMIARTREDSICSLGIAAMGFEKPTHLHSSGTLCEGMYTETKEAGQRSEAAIDRFPAGRYHALLVAPLDRAPFEPDLVCVYANPAQVMRLTQAALWKRGGKLTSAFGGRVDCAEVIVTCSGDRIFGQTQDHEMAFTIPWSQMEEVVEGLKGTHAGGIRYPITQFMEYEAKLPPRYMEVNRFWEAEKGRAEYSNRDRVVAAYKRSFADRVPVYPIVASFAGTLDGLSIEEYCTNVPKAIT